MKLLLIVLSVLVLNSLSIAEDLGPKPRGGASAKEWSDRGWAMAAETSALLDSGNPDDLAKAIDKARALMNGRLGFVTGTKADGVMRKFLEKGKFAEVVELADFGILAHPEETKEVVILQKAKVTALTKLNKGDEAIAAAKGLYNVSSMPGTAEAMQVMIETLIAADVKNAAKAEAFKQEQITGASAPALEASKLKQPLLRTGVLESIKVDPKPYEAAIAKRTGAVWMTLVGKGNLQLLADQTADAQATFDAAYLVVDPRYIAGAAEDVARAMRAADGAIGRANAWIESLRPAAALPASGDPTP